MLMIAGGELLILDRMGIKFLILFRGMVGYDRYLIGCDVIVSPLYGLREVGFDG